MTNAYFPRPHLIWLFVVTTLGSAPCLLDAQDRAVGVSAREMKALVHQAEVECVVAERDLSEAADRVGALRAEIAKATGRVEVSADALRQSVEKLQAQQEALLLDAAGADGRRQGLEQAVKKYTEVQAAKAQSDPVAAELEKVVAARQAELKLTKQRVATGVMEASAAPAAEAALAQAQAELAAARSRAAGTAAIGALDAWNRDAMNLSIEDMERQARLKYIQSRLDQYAKVMPRVSDLEQATEALHAAYARLDQARNHLLDIREKASVEEATAPAATQPAAK